MIVNTDQIEEMDSCCACCGIGEVDGIKLKNCDDCDLVRYCSDDCKENHRPDHEAMCKERAAELRDELLFKQPESSHLGECPICFLPLEPDCKKYTLHTCCSKYVCNGCRYANEIRQCREKIEETCPFCRYPTPASEEEADLINMKRAVEANDPIALREVGKVFYLNGNNDDALKYCSKAAELGNANAHCHLSYMYRDGEGVEKDEAKEIYHLEEAAIRGHLDARFQLAFKEGSCGRIKRSVKHWIIGANLGDNGSILALKLCYQAGDIRKEDFAAALRAHQAAVDATKSPQREAVAKFYGAKEVKENENSG